MVFLIRRLIIFGFKIIEDWNVVYWESKYYGLVVFCVRVIDRVKWFNKFIELNIKVFFDFEERWKFF